MRVVQAVFGVFHHFELAHQLHRRHHLQRLYSTWPWTRLKREGLPHDLVRTFPLIHTADYLLNRTGHFPLALSSRLASWNALAFDRYTAARIDAEHPDALIAISGAGLLTGRQVQQRGGIFICDRGSTHQRFQNEVVLAEHQRWGVPAPLAKPHILSREEALYAQADAITVPSTAALRSFLQMGVPATKLHVIPYGVRLDKFTPAKPAPAESVSDDATVILSEAQSAESRHPDRSRTFTATRIVQSQISNPAAFNLLFAGAVTPRKGIPYLLEAFAALRHPHKHLTIVGTIPSEIRPLLARLPTEHVTFTGPLPQPQLIRHMQRSDALVLPSVEEGLALVMAQAMACGCPVIATSATGAEDLFTDQIQGFITPDRDSTALTARMQQLADDPTLQTSMRQAGLTRVQSLGGWDHYGDLWDTLLHALSRS